MKSKLFIKVLLLICSTSVNVVANEEFKIIDQDESEFLFYLESCTPRTIEKYTRNYLYKFSNTDYLLIKQRFEIGNYCSDVGYHGNIVVSAYEVKKDSGNIAQKPIWQFESVGRTGVPEEYPYLNLYLVKDGFTRRYYSLKNGNLIALSSKDLISIQMSQTRERRFIGVQDNMSLGNFDDDHIAIIFYSDDKNIRQKLLVEKKDDKDAWFLYKIEIPGENVKYNEITIINKNEFTNMTLHFQLMCQCEASPININLPIVADSLNINSATIEGSARIKIIEADHNNLINQTGR